MKTSIQSLWVGLAVLGLSGAVAALAADEKNLVSNGGFEEVKDGVPTGWISVCSEGGSVTHTAVAEDAKEGKYCLHVKSKGEWAVAASPKVALDRTKTYTLTGFARAKSGKVSIKIDYYNGDEYLGHTESDEVSKNEWTSLKVGSQLDSYKDATHILVAGVIQGDGEGFFDAFVLTAK
jgi:hypothetical protein